MLERKYLSDSLEKKMHSYRLGITGLPEEYIAFHINLAKETMEQMKADGIKIHSWEMASDGWGDGMRVVQAIVELPGDNLFKIQWVDGNQGFMVKCKGGGWGMPIKEERSLQPYFNRAGRQKRT